MKQIVKFIENIDPLPPIEPLDALSIEQQNDFFSALQNFPYLQAATTGAGDDLEPLTEYLFPTLEAEYLGRTLLSEGKVASLIIAGGDGTRFHETKPKALEPITSIQKKTLLQHFCEKTTAAERTFKASLPLAVMTSIKNHEIIANYLEQNKNFGVSSLSIFKQPSVPLITKQGKWLLQASGKVATAPNGNGDALSLLTLSGITEMWQNKKIQYITVIPIDNLLANPFDPTLCGHHALNSYDATIKTILHHNPSEQMGILVKKKGKTAIQEYFELPEKFLTPLLIPLANIGLFCFNLSFIQKIQNAKLPWHFTNKTYLKQSIWKGEKFIFDTLDFASSTGALVYAREDVYAPIKNTAQIQKAINAMVNFERRLFQKHFPQTITPLNIELSPLLYYQK
jgi:UDP-N-acetylglucosamine/UDP-N-acetylgalactosamine diphosphorylase